MKQFYFKFAKKSFLSLFLGLGLLLVSQGMQAKGTFTTTAAGGNWADATTWVDGIAPPAVTKSDDFIIINGDVTLILNAGNTVLTTVNTPNRYTFSIGSITIAEGKTLNVTSSNGSVDIPYYFTIGATATPSTLNGHLIFDASIFGGKTIASLTVAATGSLIETKTVSLSTLANTTLTNYGTITTATLAPNATAKIENYGTLNYVGYSTSTTATTTNYVGGVFVNSGPSGGTIAGVFKNYGTYTTAGFSGTAPVAKFTNYSTGVLNFTGGAMSASALVLDATDPGNTVYYNSAGSQTVKAVEYSNLILSNKGTKTIETAASAILCKGTLSILDAAKASITNTNVLVDNLNLGGAAKTPSTYGGSSSTAAVKNSTYFTGVGYITVQNSLGVAKYSLNEMKLYPNPSVGGKFTISLPSMHEQSRVSILNVAGKAIYSSVIAADQNADINPSSALAAGVYFVKVDQAGNSATKKLIVK